MNELEIHLTERASDFPLLAQFFFKQPGRPPDDQLLANLTEILNDVANSGSPLFVNLAKRTLTDLSRLRSVGSLSNIIDGVEREFRMEPGTLQSRRTTQRIAMARQIAYYLCRTLTGASLTTVGDALGRDHSSVHHGFNLIRRRMTRDAAFRLLIEKIERQLLAETATFTAVANMRRDGATRNHDPARACRGSADSAINRLPRAQSRHTARLQGSARLEIREDRHPTVDRTQDETGQSRQSVRARGRTA
jgi:hypothetical protein